MENMECLIVEVCTPVIDLEVSVYGVSLHFISLPALWTSESLRLYYNY